MGAELFDLEEKLLAAGLEVAEADTFWLEDMRVATRPMLDLETLRARQDAVGRLVRAVDSLAAAPEAATGVTAAPHSSAPQR